MRESSTARIRATPEGSTQSFRMHFPFFLTASSSQQHSRKEQSSLALWQLCGAIVLDGLAISLISYRIFEIPVLFSVATLQLSGKFTRLSSHSTKLKITKKAISGNFIFPKYLPTNSH